QVTTLDAAKGMALYYQDVLQTGVGGRLRARLEDGSIISVGSQSKLTVLEHDARTQQSTFQIEFGKVRAQ
ncbi:FecR family protein, partial [[Ruminococcus] torques]|uniref:FecR domain-containing protein n=1 Tax=[Ruminococcus] torques TaxID=33039 RepID=UPI001EDC9FF0